MSIEKTRLPNPGKKRGCPNPGSPVIMTINYALCITN